jgi:hypothetical protein
LKIAGFEITCDSNLNVSFRTVTTQATCHNMKWCSASDLISLY